jgi:hypothetical protein
MQRFCGPLPKKKARSLPGRSRRLFRRDDTKEETACGAACLLPFPPLDAAPLALDLAPEPSEDSPMFRNRFSTMPPPQPVPEPTPSPSAFFLCPVVWFPPASPAQGDWQQDLFRWALAQAQAVVRPSLLERDLLGVWN